MIAAVVVRHGELPAGGAETVAECAGRAVLIGSGTDRAAAALDGIAVELTLVETATCGAVALRDALLALLRPHDIVVLPGSADGRDLAPRLAAGLHRPLLANATRVDARRVDVARGQMMQRLTPDGPFVATLVPGVRGVVADQSGPPTIQHSTATPASGHHDPDSLEVLSADAATVDLSEARRIVAGGGGLDSPARFEQLAEFGAVLDASVGATRVITDRHWVDHQRQIGTTGVVVDPLLYIAFGVSGAVQHTAGLGHPAHVVSVNTDPHCPMMQLADLAVVADANATLDELVKLVPR